MFEHYMELFANNTARRIYRSALKKRGPGVVAVPLAFTKQLHDRFGEAYSAFLFQRVAGLGHAIRQRFYLTLFCELRGLSQNGREGIAARSGLLKRSHYKGYRSNFAMEVDEEIRCVLCHVICAFMRIIR